MIFKITVLIAVHNRLSYLKKCLDSVLKQISDEVEILVIDDGSYEETVKWLKSIQVRNFNVIYQPNRGVAKARQLGLENAKGDFVMILDSDDYLEPRAIYFLMKYIRSHPHIDLFYTNNLEIYSNGRKKKSTYKQFKNNSSFIKSILLNPIVPFKHSGTTFNRNKALDIGGYDISLPCKIDIDFILNCLKNDFNCFLIKNPLVRFNFHEESISRSKRLVGVEVWFKIIDKYGPNFQLQKNIYKILRCISEYLKFLFENAIIFKKYEKFNSIFRK